MTAAPKQEPFRVVDAPERADVDTIRGWTNVVPLPNRGLATAFGDPVEEIAFVVYQLQRGEKP